MVELRDRRHHHIRKILKARPGDSLRAGIINGNMGTATVVSISREASLLAITADIVPDAPPPVHLILALPRPVMLKRVLAQAAAFGVGRVSLIRANRVEKSFLSASLVGEKNFRPFLLNGLEQAVATRLPEVDLHPRFRPFVEDTLPLLLNGGTAKFVAHPDGAADIAAVERPAQDQPVALAVGPEGGWVEYEVERFRRLGFTAVTMGPRILRVDSAVPALLSQIDLLRRLRR